MENNKLNEEQLAEKISKRVVKDIKKDLPKSSVFKFSLKDIIMIGIIVVLVIIGVRFSNMLDKNTSVEKPVENHDLTIENNGIFGYQAVDFEEAVLGAATKQALLVVDEQEISVVSPITQTGLFNLGIFSKNQSVTYYGIAQYTIDLSKITKNKITVDDASHTVTVKAPHPEFHNVSIDPKKTVFSDTERGLLAFGDIEMNIENANKIEAEAVNKLTDRAKEKDVLEKAYSYGSYVLRDFFETSIESVTNSYKVKIIYE